MGSSAWHGAPRTTSFGTGRTGDSGGTGGDADVTGTALAEGGTLGSLRGGSGSMPFDVVVHANAVSALTQPRTTNARISGS
jgi:hypothetical protein